MEWSGCSFAVARLPFPGEFIAGAGSFSLITTSCLTARLISGMILFISGAATSHVSSICCSTPVPGSFLWTSCWGRRSRRPNPSVAHPGIELASHTWSHPNLARLSEAECKREFASADAWLRERFALEPSWSSYPFGMHGAAAERAAASSGYRGVFRIDGGWLPARSDQRLRFRFRLPRLNVPASISLDGFALRLAGLLGG